MKTLQKQLYISQTEKERRRKISESKKKQWQNVRYREKMEEKQRRLGLRQYYER